MPVRNEADFIERSLGAVLAQDYPPECLEVIVADGRSTDNTRALIQQLQTRYPRLQLIDNPGGIVPTGLNAALRQAQGTVIVRVDGHCEIAPDYVRRCVALLQQHAATGVGGPLATLGQTPRAQTIALAMSSPFGVGGSAFRTGRNQATWVDTIAFPAYTRAALQQAGAFDEELVRNQDDEYNYRLRALGGRLLLAPEVRARYYSRASFGALWRQYFQYGLWKVRVLQKHPRQMSWRQFVPPAFVAALGLSFGAALLVPHGWLLLLVMSLAYGLANLFATFYTARRHGWQHTLGLPLAFASLHLGYGLGFWVGLFKFWQRWGDKVGKVPPLQMAEEGKG